MYSIKLSSLIDLRMSSPLMVLRFSAIVISQASQVIKAMNSLTHSYTHSRASFEILVSEGRAAFIILLMLAIGKNRS